VSKYKHRPHCKCSQPHAHAHTQMCNLCTQLAHDGQSELTHHVSSNAIRRTVFRNSNRLAAEIPLQDSLSTITTTAAASITHGRTLTWIDLINLSDGVLPHLFQRLLGFHLPVIHFSYLFYRSLYHFLSHCMLSLSLYHVLSSTAL
jgi:hypothetical protein